MEEELFNEISLNDEKILNTLSEVGVYITNYSNGATLVSNVWKDLPDHFRVNDKDYFFTRLIHPDDRERICKALSDLYNGKLREFHEIFRIVLDDGTLRWVYSLGKTVQSTKDGKPILFIGSDSDITDLKGVEEKLRISIEKEKKRSRELETLRQVVSAISSSLDMEETVQKILYEIRRIIPYEAGSIQVLRDGYLHVIGAEGFENNAEICSLKFKYPELGSLSTLALQENKPCLTNDVSLDFPRFIQPEGTRRICSWIGIPLISQGEIIGLMALDAYNTNHFNKHHLELAGIVGNQISIAMDNARLHEKAYRMAMEDALTGIGSRHRIKMEGRLMFETAIRSQSNIALVILDIDHFKSVNDDFGHDLGDVVLKRIAGVCTEEIRGIDLLGRYGGEEFLIVLPGTDSYQAAKAMDRLRSKIQTLQHPEIGRPVTVSGGLYAGIPRENEKMGYFISMADKELYKAKSMGRNRICWSRKS